MDIYEYWIGRHIDAEKIWDSFDKGKEDYIEKFKSTEVYVLRLSFDKYPINMPLFDYEAIAKTVKYLYHELKHECFSSQEYNEFGPLYLYQINRGSAIWDFLGEINPLILFSSVLDLIKQYQNIEKQSLENFDKKVESLKKLYPQASNLDISEYTAAKTCIGRNKVIKRLAEQGLKKVEISKEPFSGNKDINYVDTSSI